jgi:putative hydrolase of the HAD superfamily
MLKGIIFDVGGVLIRTQNRTRRDQWATQAGWSGSELEALIFGSESSRQAQLGQKSATTHWQWVGEQLGLDQAGLAILHHEFFAGDALDHSLLAYIGRLRGAGYRTGLLSNIGNDGRQLLTEQYPILDYFDGAVLSAEVGLMKPDPQIYHLAAHRTGVKPEEALFIDDFIENVAGAKAVGMQGIHFTDSDGVRQKLAALTGVALY